MTALSMRKNVEQCSLNRQVLWIVITGFYSDTCQTDRTHMWGKAIEVAQRAGQCYLYGANDFIVMIRLPLLHGNNIEISLLSLVFLPLIVLSILTQLCTLYHYEYAFSS